MTNFASRLLVATVGLPLALGMLWLGGWWLFTLVTVAAVVAVHEFVTTARPLRPLGAAIYGGVLLALFGAQSGGIVWLLAGFLATFVLGFVLLLRQMHDQGRLLAFAVVLTVFAADTLAYFTGRVAGRHSLAPRLSPKKTWEGLVGGTLAGVFVSFISLYDTRDEYLCVWQAIVLGLVVVVAAVLGDLFESALKRDLEVKDTGRLLGGHGGVLDRVDALLFAAPAAYFLVVSYGFR